MICRLEKKNLYQRKQKFQIKFKCFFKLKKVVSIPRIILRACDHGSTLVNKGDEKSSKDNLTLLSMFFATLSSALSSLMLSLQNLAAATSSSQSKIAKSSKCLPLFAGLVPMEESCSLKEASFGHSAACSMMTKINGMKMQLKIHESNFCMFASLMKKAWDWDYRGPTNTDLFVLLLKVCFIAKCAFHSKDC